METYICQECDTKFVILDTPDYGIDRVVFCPNCAGTQVDIDESDLD